MIYLIFKIFDIIKIFVNTVAIESSKVAIIKSELESKLDTINFILSLPK